jgi:hypothetical protein
MLSMPLIRATINCCSTRSCNAFVTRALLAWQRCAAVVLLGCPTTTCPSGVRLHGHLCAGGPLVWQGFTCRVSDTKVWWCWQIFCHGASHGCMLPVLWACLPYDIKWNRLTTSAVSINSVLCSVLTVVQVRLWKGFACLASTPVFQLHTPAWATTTSIKHFEGSCSVKRACDLLCS